MNKVLKRGLTIDGLKKIFTAVIAVVKDKGPDFYGWINPPVYDDGGKFSHTSGYGESAETRQISPAEACGVFEKKLNGAYGERFVMSMGLVASLIQNGYSVRFVQFQAEAGVPFNASGWTVMVIETMPVFHISPDDLRLTDVENLVEILTDNQDPEVAWKNTNKVGEFAALLAGSVEPDLDLVRIAQENS